MHSSNFFRVCCPKPMEFRNVKIRSWYIDLNPAKGFDFKTMFFCSFYKKKWNFNFTPDLKHYSIPPPKDVRFWTYKDARYLWSDACRNCDRNHQVPGPKNFICGFQPQYRDFLRTYGTFRFWVPKRTSLGFYTVEMFKMM